MLEATAIYLVCVLAGLAAITAFVTCCSDGNGSGFDGPCIRVA